MNNVLRVAIVMGLLTGAEAFADGSAIRRYLATPQGAAETSGSRLALAEVAADLDALAGAPAGRFCGTGLAQRLFEQRDDLSPSARQVLREVMPALLQRPSLPAFLDSPPFRIHYSTTGPDSVRNASTDTASDGVPTYVHITAQSLQRAWTLLVDSTGYAPPPGDGSAGGGTDLYDCYLAIPIQFFVIGFTAAETGFPRIVGADTIIFATSYQVIHPTMEPFPQAAPHDLLRITCAHEFYHAMHFSQDVFEKPPWQEAGWWLEGNAVWFEDLAFPTVNDWSNLPPYLNAPQRSITHSNSPADLHPYGGGSMWSFYLVERFDLPAAQPPGTMLRNVWTRCGLASGDNTLSALNAELIMRGSTLESAWHEFTSWCMRTGNRHDDSSFAQGADWPQAQPVTALFDYPRAVHFTNGSDNLDQSIAAGTPITRVDSADAPLEALAFAPVGHVPLSTQQPNGGMRLYPDATVGLPVQFSYIGIDTASAGLDVIWDTIATGDTTAILDWLVLDAMYVVASAAEWYAPQGGSDGDSLGRVTPWISLAVDTAAQDAFFLEPYPNPVDLAKVDSVVFPVTIPGPGVVWLDIFTVAGDRVWSVEVSDTWPSANVTWKLRNQAGTRVASGLYLCKITAELEADGRRAEKMYRVGVVR